MDTDRLRLFVLAADKLNISAAGRELGMAPAVASARLAKLEHALGADLLHRSTRKVALSLEGAEFLPFAREILEQEDAARAALGQGSATPIGTLRFTASSTFAQLYIAPLIPELVQRHPGINLDLRFSDAQFDLIQGSFDLALRSSSLADSSLKSRKLTDDELVFCASPDYLAKHGTPEVPSDLGHHHLVAFREHGPKKLTGPHGCSGHFDPCVSRCRVVVHDGLSLKITTIAGAGISMNSLWSVHREIVSGSLVHVLPNHTIDAPLALWLVYPKSNVMTTKVRVFIDFLLEKIGNVPPWLGSR